jgi:tetratricopeptide (TPR) repeat protein
MRTRDRLQRLEQAREAMTAKRFAIAREQLVGLATTYAGDSEVQFLLGECELARGNREEALAAWAKVGKSSPFFGRAALGRATHLINSGRYRLAEEVLIDSLADRDRPERFELERAQSRLYRFEGRTDDVRRVLRSSFAQAPDPASILRELWFHDTTPVPVEALLLALEKADASDDRVWLGLANQAILTGRFADAATWIDRCLAARPTDVSVWRARLDLAVASGRPEGVWEAIEKLPAEALEPAAIHALRAWLAALRQDSALELTELAAVLETAPGNARALERLSVLTLKAGKQVEAERLRHRKAEVDRAQAEVRKMMLDGQELAPRAADLATLMNTLGRPFDARGWKLLAETQITPAAATKPGTGEPRAFFTGSAAARARALASDYANPSILEQENGAPLREPRGTPAGPSSRISGISRPTLADAFADLRALKISEMGVGTATRTESAAKTTSPAFVDDAERSGLRFAFDNGRTPRFLMPETNSGGVALIDYDGDGWLDVYCVQGGALIDLVEPRPSPRTDGDRLFRNQRDGTFRDVTQEARIAAVVWNQGYGMGVTVGDYDNDGHPDLFVTRLERYVLLRNRGDGSFEDASERSGLAGRRDNPSSAAFADLDNDGDLDLYVCHYMIWDPANPPVCVNEKGNYFYCSPQKVQPAPDHVFRNDNGHFVDVTAAAGFTDVEGRGLGVVAADVDGDNRVDLYVANDGTANFLFHNKGGFRFEETGLEAGVAGSAEGGYRAGMGVACGDLDGDGQPELLVTNFYGEGTTVYQNLGQGLFADRSAATGLGLATRYLLGFGIALADITNDGRLDVLITNGHVNDNRPYYLYAMPSRLYENQPDGRFVDVSDRAGPPWSVERVGRGLAAGDVDNDGRIDAVILAQNEPVAYFHNQTPDRGNFVTFALEGTKSNRDGVGARVSILAGGQRQVSQRTGGGSYQSAGDPRIHFGLGKSTQIDRVEVRWPSGTVDRYGPISAGAGYLLREGDKSPRPLAGFQGHPPSPSPALIH